METHQKRMSQGERERECKWLQEQKNREEESKTERRRAEENGGEKCDWYASDRFRFVFSHCTAELGAWKGTPFAHTYRCCSKSIKGGRLSWVHFLVHLKLSLSHTHTHTHKQINKHTHIVNAKKTMFPSLIVTMA